MVRGDACTQHRVCDGDPSVNDPKLPRFYNGPARRTYGGVNVVPSNNYSGWAANTQNLNMDDAYAQWNAPCIPPGWDRGNKASSHWVGMGGWQNSPLLQVGTYSNDDGSAHPYYEAWVENYTGSDGGATTVFPIGCADQIYGEVWLPNHVFIEDSTNGQSYGNTLGPTAGSMDFQCISEYPEPAGGGLGGGLADFNYTYYHNCRADDGLGDSFDFYNTPTPAWYEFASSPFGNSDNIMSSSSLGSTNADYYTNWLNYW